MEWKEKKGSHPPGTQLHSLLRVPGPLLTLLLKMPHSDQDPLLLLVVLDPLGGPWLGSDQWAGFGGCVYLGPECSARQRVPLAAVPAESLSPENESISGSMEGPEVLREAPPLWWAPQNPLSLGCFWAMTLGLPEDFRSQPSW
jgi:hypothetical protein